MKFIIFISILLISFNIFASSDACKGYADNHDQIIFNISAQKNRDLRMIQIEYQQNMNKCDNQECRILAKESYQSKVASLNELEKNAILSAYKTLSDLCKN